MPDVVSRQWSDRVLSPRQSAVLRFVREFWESNGYGPSIREIGTGVGLTSIGGVVYQVDRLVGLGLVERNPLIARSIRPARVVSESSDARSETGRINGGPVADGPRDRTDPNPADTGPEPPMTITPAHDSFEHPAGAR